MSGLRVLITNMTLAGRTGTETAVQDLALGLLRAGHSPVVYTPDPGDIALELRKASVPVVDDLSNLSAMPDVIHGNHHAETVTALLHFGGVPAINVCHAFIPSVAAPPRHPRVLRYVAVDDACRERLVCEHGIPESRVRVLRNAVDLNRFQLRGPLPPRPARALVFSNYATSETHLPAVRAACKRLGLALDVLGSGIGTGRADPEAILGDYDVVFAKGRCALEALASGTSVILCDSLGCGPMVTTSNLTDLRRLNFGFRAFTAAPNTDVLATALEAYDPADAAKVSRQVRDFASLETAVQEYVDLYEEVIAEHRQLPAIEPAAEARAVAGYLRQVTAWAKEIRAYEELARARQQECDRLRAELQRVESAAATPVAETTPAAPARSPLIAGLRRFAGRVADKVWRPTNQVARRRWHFRPGTWDQAIFESVAIRNEYRLPDRFAPGDVILDIGAHIGSFGYATLSRGAGTIYACEAFPANALSVRHNLKPYGRRAIVLNAAVWRSDRPAPASLYFTQSSDSQNTGGGGVVTAPTDRAIPAVPFDSIVDRATGNGKRRVRMLKLDCEGAEWPILFTSRRLHLIDAICGEYHLGVPVERYELPGVTAFTTDVLRELLTHAGFEVEIEPAAVDPRFGHFFATAKRAANLRPAA